MSMSLTDEQIDTLWKAPMSADWEHREFARAIESAATAPLLEQIKELEAEVMLFREHALNEKAARLELERQIELVRNEVLEEAAESVDTQIHRWFDDRARYCASECAAAIRSMKTEVKP
jgi:hypothetical protein